MTQMLENSVQELKQTIHNHDGTNVAGASFCRQVEDLIGVFYDDIGSIVTVSIRSLFDLFVIKVLYVERQSRDASVIDYLGDMLGRYLYMHELFPMAGGGNHSLYYFSDILSQMEQGSSDFQNRYEVFRKYGDNALFIAGIFPRSLRRHRPGRLGGSRLVDTSYYVSTGKASYRLAAEHDRAEFIQQRFTLFKLSEYFEVYMDALNEMSERYILGFDMNLIADKLLDNFNLYQRSGDEHYLDNALKYAAVLRIDEQRFPALFRQRKGYIIGN